MIRSQNNAGLQLLQFILDVAGRIPEELPDSAGTLPGVGIILEFLRRRTLI